MEPLLSTKLYIPRSRPKLVTRPRLIQQLNEGLHASHTAGVTLISAPAGFGKTTLLSSWIYDLRFASDDLRLGSAKEVQIENPKSSIVNRVAWLSLDEEDNDPARFLAYLISALQTIGAKMAEGVLASLQSPQPPPMQPILTTLLNEITTIPDNFILVLDDYHVIDSRSVDKALTFLLEHQPPQMQLVIATREDPPLPLARLRAHGQLTELRAADLRFTLSESVEFLDQIMGLKLSAATIAALETRTEGWITALTLASLHEFNDDYHIFISGDHRHLADYLAEEVLDKQPRWVQEFLLTTAILNSFNTELCDAITERNDSRNILDTLERDNLFILPLDKARQQYRYH